MLRLLCIWLLPTLVLAQEGLFISNSTHILFRSPSGDRLISVHGQADSRIVALAVDAGQHLLFWSDISLARRGIYKATVASDGMLIGLIRIISDVGEVNGLAVDWVSRHLYLADATARSLEVTLYDGSQRRALTLDSLINPRGLIVDPNEGWLYWSDQGTKTIERSRLDGSDSTVLLSQADGLYWPNHMTLLNGNVYYVDGRHRTLSRLDGSGGHPVANLSAQSNNALFGITTDGTVLFISSWQQSKVLQYAPTSGQQLQLLTGLGTTSLFGLAYLRASLQPVTATSQPCRNGAQNGCSHLCLPVDASTSRCSCPSFGRLRMQSDRRTCSAPSQVLFYALAERGVVGFRDVESGLQGDPDRYLVGRSARPVAVAYDPVDQTVFWSDVHESVVHRAQFDGSAHTPFLTSSTHSIGVVDGLTVDSVHRKLYYTNMGEVTVSGEVHAWHRIEFIGLDGRGRRTVVNSLDKPRGLYVQPESGHLYYTDWGATPRVVRTALDGSEATVLRVAGLHNPNAVLVTGDRLYVLDSHHKTRQQANYPEQSLNGNLYRSNLDGSGWTRIADTFQTPFGLAAMRNGTLCVSDWEQGFVVLDQAGGATVADGSWAQRAPMALLYSTISASVESSRCDGEDCAQLCVLGGGAAPECTCDSYTPRVPSAASCISPGQMLLFGDHNSVKMLPLDGQVNAGVEEVPTPQVVVEGHPYFSNYVALAFDTTTNKLYFTDVNREAVYWGELGGKATVFYRAEGVIDGLDLDLTNNRLYWTEITNITTGQGRIVSMDKSGGARNIIVSGLNRPRAIRANPITSQVYFTEWGSNPRVARVSYSGAGSAQTLVPATRLGRPNALDLLVAQQRLLVGDADRAVLIECNLDGESCDELAVVGGGPSHIYSVLYASADLILLTDWLRRTISVYDKSTQHMTDLATDLMRPTEMVLRFNASSLSCPAEQTCALSASCSALPGGYYCHCPEGQRLQNEPQPTCTTVGYPTEDPDQCDECLANQVCAASVGTAQYFCQCNAGYRLSGATCQACSVNTYKAHAGSGGCIVCPAGSQAGPASAQCQCGGNQVWDWHSRSCADANPGQCPASNIPLLSDCQANCSRDSGCTGAQKCCAVDGCGWQCRDPVDTPGLQCVYSGVVYQIGESFNAGPCVHCMCTADKRLGNPQYGQAVCHTQTCPAPPCDVHITLPNTCCPVCTDPKLCETEPLSIQNCPDREQQTTLPSTGPSLAYRYALEVVDHCGPSREVTRYEEQVVLYSGATQRVTLWAQAPAPGGGLHRAECSVALNLIDVDKPVVECPASLTMDMDVHSEDVVVTIPPPKVEDNVCGREVNSRLLASCEVRLEAGGQQRALTSRYGPGRHALTLTVIDSAANTQHCNFTLTVRRNENLECVVPSVNNGWLECGSGSTCRLQCQPDYVATYNMSSTCSHGAWSPALPLHLQQQACARRVSHQVLTSLRVLGLPCPRYSADLLAAGLERTVQRHYLAAGPPGAQLYVTAQACRSGQTDAFQVTFWLSANYTTAESYSEVSRQLEQLCDRLRRDIEQGELLTAGGQPLSGGEVHLSNATAGCPRGQKQFTVQDTNLCLECPVGTKWEDQNTCSICPKDTYQDMEGRAYCLKCEPDRVTTEVGAASRDMCMILPPTTKEPPSFDAFTVAVGASVGGAVLILVVVIVIVAVVCCRRQKTNTPLENNPTDPEYTNPTYEEVYDEIDEDETRNANDEVTEPTPAVRGYEKLNAQQRQENPYVSVTTQDDSVTTPATQ